ncbi:RhoGEF domain [Pelomyxa schiedti]|nr:RhoGEF domain [Pelomyxa schiedti]
MASASATVGEGALSAPVGGGGVHVCETWGDALVSVGFSCPVCHATADCGTDEACKRLQPFAVGPLAVLLKDMYQLLKVYTPTTHDLNQEIKSMTEKVETALNQFFEPEDQRQQAVLAQKHRARLFVHTLEELYATESDYVRDLTVMIEVWQPELKKTGAIATADLGIIFNDLYPLLSLSKDLLELFKNAKEAPLAELRLGEKLKKMIPFLQLYSQYMQSQGKVRDILTAAKKNTKFLSHLEKVKHTVPAVKNLDLNDYLIKPVQRVAKYPLLLKQLSESIPPDHADFAVLNEALDKMRSVLVRINDAQKEQESRTIINELTHNLTWTNVPYDLIASKVLLILQKKLKFSVLKHPEEQDGNYVILFDRAILLCNLKKKTGKLQEISFYPLVECTLHPGPPSSTQFTITSKNPDEAVLFSPKDIHASKLLFNALTEALKQLPLNPEKALVRKDAAKDKTEGIACASPSPIFEKEAVHTDQPTATEEPSSLPKPELPSMDNVTHLSVQECPESFQGKLVTTDSRSKLLTAHNRLSLQVLVSNPVQLQGVVKQGLADSSLLRENEDTSKSDDDTPPVEDNKAQVETVTYLSVNPADAPATEGSESVPGHKHKHSHSHSHKHRGDIGSVSKRSKKPPHHAHSPSPHSRSLSPHSDNVPTSAQPSADSTLQPKVTPSPETKIPVNNPDQNTPNNSAANCETSAAAGTHVPDSPNEPKSPPITNKPPPAESSTTINSLFDSGRDTPTPPLASLTPSLDLQSPATLPLSFSQGLGYPSLGSGGGLPGQPTAPISLGSCSPFASCLGSSAHAPPSLLSSSLPDYNPGASARLTTSGLNDFSRAFFSSAAPSEASSNFSFSCKDSSGRAMDPSQSSHSPLSSYSSFLSATRTLGNVEFHASLPPSPSPSSSTRNNHSSLFHQLNCTTLDGTCTFLSLPSSPSLQLMSPELSYINMPPSGMNTPTQTVPVALSSHRQSHNEAEFVDSFFRGTTPSTEYCGVSMAPMGSSSPSQAILSSPLIADFTSPSSTPFMFIRETSADSTSCFGTDSTESIHIPQREPPSMSLVRTSTRDSRPPISNVSLLSPKSAESTCTSQSKYPHVHLVKRKGLRRRSKLSPLSPSPVVHSDSPGRVALPCYTLSFVMQTRPRVAPSFPAIYQLLSVITDSVDDVMAIILDQNGVALHCNTVVTRALGIPEAQFSQGVQWLNAIVSKPEQYQLHGVWPMIVSGTRDGTRETYSNLVDTINGPTMVHWSYVSVSDPTNRSSPLVLAFGNRSTSEVDQRLSMAKEEIEASFFRESHDTEDNE